MSQQINLLNPELLTIREWIDARMIAVLSGLLALLMLTIYGWSSHRVTQLAHEQQAASAQLASLKQQLDLSIKQHTVRAPSETLQKDVAMAEAALKDRQQVLAFIQGGTFGYAQGFSGYMEAFARQSMKGLWLTGFTINDSVNQIKISGRALKPNLVPQYISGLGLEPVFKGREFAALEMGAIAQPIVTTNTVANQGAKLGSVASNATTPASTSVANTTPAIIEFRLQSQEKKPVAEGDPQAAVEKKI